MTDTVFILGAGFSKDAGIPLLGEFVDQMWDLAIRGKASAPLDESDRRLFAAAMKIRDELDGYHGRAAFNDRNIEDLLSILSFNVLGGGRKDREKLDTMSAAIARTIELTCTVQHPGVDLRTSKSVKDGPNVYRDFWKALFKESAAGRKLPSIITFNYDLVLERSLLQVLIGTHYGASNALPFKRFQIDYHYSALPPRPYDVRYTTFESWSSGRSLEEGSILVEPNATQTLPLQSIEILKLHGSLNFPRKASKASGSNPDVSFTLPVPEPHILPPVFNKVTGDAASAMWRIAIERIRSAKNVVIVGYSLPSTDIYMQYFLKAGVGPNRNLNRLFVFDPVLFSDSPSRDAMESRYASCFSPQLRDRIDFRPTTRTERIRQGTAEAFVNMLSNKPGTLIF